MSDLISRQAAIDALDVLCQENRYKILGKIETYSQYNEAWQDALDRAERAIFNLPSVTLQPNTGNWIPCSERLPEEGEDIIVTYVDDEETRIIPVNYDKGTWYDCIFDTALNPIKVIAWMPLPEPYREERTEE